MEKLLKLRETFEEQGIDGINRRYLTDFTGSAGTVLVTKTKAYQLVDFRYTSQANAQTNGFTVKEIDRAIISEEIAHLVKSLEINSLGLEQQHVSFQYYTQLSKCIKAELVTLSNAVEKLRMIKNEAEIAAEISDAAFSHILTVIRPGT
ncbi:aminopeptidase P family N-terminal domain-containing protein [Psychrobacillus sp. INOP01]|nr:aminopeptidase P family N-terminal domain-containing protein [Psychrobacillus sp. INOP01]QUG42616.1 aminopeptidase P family N-terminal domain-containing protein [Psychrobacillus sp. INOP01]